MLNLLPSHNFLFLQLLLGYLFLHHKLLFCSLSKGRLNAAWRTHIGVINVPMSSISFVWHPGSLFTFGLEAVQPSG